jgi:HEAT repeat protein
MRTNACAGILLLLTACSTAGVPVAADSDAAVRALADSGPGRWHETLPPVLRSGPAAGAPLRRELARQPQAPGRQAVVAALGRSGDDRAAAELLRLVATRDPDAAEAAIALGACGSAAAWPALREAACDAQAPTRLRAAAAAALLRLGERQTSVPLLAALLLASTPQGRERARTHALPFQTRWAEERWLAIDAIAQACDGETFGLDPDAPWPRLAAGVEQFEARMAGR